MLENSRLASLTARHPTANKLTKELGLSYHKKLRVCEDFISIQNISTKY